MKEFLKRRWVYHLLIWIVLYLSILLLNYIRGENSDSFSYDLIEPIILLSPVIITSYLAFWSKAKLFDKRNYLLYFIAAAIIVVIGVFIYEALDGLDGKIGNKRSQNITNFIFVQVIVLGIQYFKRGIINQYQVQELKAKTAITELNALKAQINPHFLFNTLNNIYGMNQIDSQKGSEMIMELSDVMRYHLEFSKAGKVRLEDEIQLLNSYIKLERLRLRDTCDLQIDFEDLDEGLMISPLLFIPFVENAFKHGTHPTKNCFVHIKLSTTEKDLSFTVKNSIIENRKVVKTNIGLQNTKRRLELLFPEKHQLTISRNESSHLVQLDITL